MNETPESREDLLWNALCQSQRLDLTGEITGGMVHDLNNGLSIVNGLVELLQEKLSAGAGSGPSPDAAQLLDLARRDLPRILIWMETSMAGAHRLLDYAYRLREGGGEVDVNALCAAAVDESRYRCERQGIQVALDLADDLPTVDGQPGQLMQILANVLRNSREGGARADADAGLPRVIYLSTSHDAGRVIVHIDDDGPGLPTGVCEDEIFGLAYSTKMDAAAGSGLPVARAIARGHGGDLRLGERVAGTRMVLELPAAG